MNVTAPVMIGYQARRPWPYSAERSVLPPHIEEMCNVGERVLEDPPGWLDLWLHNEMWAYDTEVLAWAVAVDGDNLKSLSEKLASTWNGLPGSMEAAMDDYISRHVSLPDSMERRWDSRFDWHLYAYRLIPLQFRDGKDDAFEIPAIDVQALPGNYEWLGFDVAGFGDGGFSQSPLYHNGHYSNVPVNRYCLVANLDLALQMARHWATPLRLPDGSYNSPAERGPYFVVEVFRRRRGR